jgi:hypothetical protein
VAQVKIGLRDLINAVRAFERVNEDGARHDGTARCICNWFHRGKSIRRMGNQCPVATSVWVVFLMVPIRLSDRRVRELRRRGWAEW